MKRNMMRILLATLMIFASASAWAQKEPLATPFAVPVDSITKKITYEKVVEVKNIGSPELYSRIYDWFKTYYKNPTEVIRENDSLKFKIVGKPRFRMTNPGSAKDETVQYTITVMAREGRFRYELTDFNWKQISIYPCERWLDTKAAGYNPLYNDYLQQLDKTANEVVAALIYAATHNKPVKDKDNW
jgi:hypothetical protein